MSERLSTRSSSVALPLRKKSDVSCTHEWQRDVPTTSGRQCRDSPSTGSISTRSCKRSHPIRPLPSASAGARSGARESELPLWILPITERLQASLEILDALAARIEGGSLEELRFPLEISRKKLREAAELLESGPPVPPVN